MGTAHGWQLFAHPLLLDQLQKLTVAVEAAKRRDPDGWRTNANAKLLAALAELMFERIPRDPAHPDHRQGGTLGAARKHWFRAKFGGGRFRLFFRYQSKQRIIVYAWVNDRDTLRAHGARTDSYAVFKAMLERGNPPDDWPALLAAAEGLAKDGFSLEIDDNEPPRTRRGPARSRSRRPQ